ncbi:tetratricopeptide repeat protein [Algoriphagus sp. NG3]|uniref:tetratricopeptide repeat protein n=1 Tax=Algoriphagus sp. NG3 TaxID=3097546 RepID=UPI002A80C50C|nr:tetratricopeptide repeat protein [Algoriphagus sp. NG3]WPR73367.1 tetratricopeptide repeat protein [Algoriphagus sp. NG3]
MKKPTYPYRLLVGLAAFLISSSCLAQMDLLRLKNSDEEAVFFEDSLLLHQSDTQINELQQTYAESLAQGDTLEAITALNSLSSIYTNRVNYAKSYDGYWQAMLLAEQVGDEKSKATSYNGLAILYSLYERREEALKYYSLALDIHKRLISAGKIDSLSLRESYFPLAVHYKYEGQFGLANAYLDSCELIKTTKLGNSLLTQAERAHIQVLNGDLQSARQLFETLEEGMKKQKPEFLIIFYNYIADMHFLSGQLNASENRYRQAITAAFEHQRHLNYIPDIYEKLATVLAQSGKAVEANHYLKLANDINRSLYSSRSPNNRYLLEIKDEFRLQQQRNKEAAQAQELKNLQQENEISQLQKTLLIIGIGFIISIGFFIFKYWRAKHKAEKKRIENLRKLEAEKAQEIVQIKNQELTGSTLKIIAKDELLNEVKENLRTLESNPDPKDLKKLIRAIDFNKDQSWLDFEKRFLALNENFYEKIRALHPNLKPYDLKICALIKLDFSGKEIARLLGISPESANTSRYRLRKKLELKTEDNLTEYIQRI